MNTEPDHWTVPVDHPAFAGHFPGRPIVPGVVLLDHVIRLADHRQTAPVSAWHVSQAKFLSPVEPGETLRFELQGDQRGGWRFSVRTEQRQVAAGSLAPAA